MDNQTLFEVYVTIGITLLIIGAVIITFIYLWLKSLDDLVKSYEELNDKIKEYNKGKEKWNYTLKNQ